MFQLSFTEFPVLYTDRLVLRRIERDDAQQIFMLRSDTEVMAYLDRDPMQSVEEGAELISRIDTSFQSGDGISWAISLKDNATMIGYAGIWRIDKPHYRGEIGYTLSPAFWGKGIMSEALKAIVAFGFHSMNLHSMEANINPNNIASIKIVEKLGFVREAYFMENYYYNGKFLDSAIYSLVNK